MASFAILYVGSEHVCVEAEMEPISLQKKVSNSEIEMQSLNSPMWR